MLENKSGLYAAFMAKDTRFDGRFFVGISSTGIYCRPVCRAKQPKAENCTFYHTAAEAEQAGYRPCLLCRPELAPGSSITDAAADLVYRAARMLEENCGSGQSLGELSRRLGCTDRHLRRVFTAEYNVSPVQYLQTCRLLLAKNLLTDTDLSVLEVAMAAGFGSLRRFNDLFKKHYHLSPTALRKRTLEEKKPGGDVTLALGYRPPYPWDQILQFLDGHAIPGIDMVKDRAYIRTVHLVTVGKKHVYGWVRVSHKLQKNALSVTVSETLLSVLPQVLARIRYLFDLYCDPDAVYETLQVMNDVRPGLCILGTRLPGCFNTFEMAVRTVLGQQITVRAANTLAARIASSYGTSIQTGISGLTHVFPSPEDILALEGAIENHFGPLGVITARSRTIYELAKGIVEGKIQLTLPAQPEKEIKKLTEIPGIGSWTAQYIAMRAMGWPDAFLEMAKEWSPWRSYAAINLWNRL